MSYSGFIFFLVAVSTAVAADAASVQVAVVVHPDNELSNLSSRDLERTFLLRQQRWSTGRRIYLLMREEGSVSKDIVLEKIYRMTSDQLKRFWLAKIYRGEMTSFPKTLRSDESVLRFVSQAPNAIGFIDATRSDERVKVLRIDGLLPGMDGYSLTDEER